MHTFLEIPYDMIPFSVFQSVPTFVRVRRSNDGSMILLDGYRNGQLVHPPETFDVWLRGEPKDNRAGIIEAILAASTEYTYAEIKLLELNPLSIWYVEADLPI